MKRTTESSLEFIQSRRSVFPKEFEDGNLSNAEIASLLEAARWAPTHKVTEPWRFQVFLGQGLERLVSTQVEASAQRLDDESEVKAKAAKYNMLATQSAAVVAVVMQRDPRERVPLYEEEWAVACAVQNIYLHAASHRIGMYWSTGAERDQPSVRKLLQLADRDVHMGWLFMGRYSGQKTLHKERLSVDEIVKFHRN